MAVLAVPKPAPAPTSVTIVEYYHAQLDHYFITGIPDEITKLDNGTFVGWQRTGQTFRGYAIGSAGRTGRRPVCREYGNPAADLNSHFYSASPDECSATLVNGGGYKWLLEASEVFQMDLPDPVTGACPPVACRFIASSTSARTRTTVTPRASPSATRWWREVASPKVMGPMRSYCAGCRNAGSANYRCGANDLGLRSGIRTRDRQRGASADR
jgi:hypothetical protein